jgi:ABC-2 type transport system ATP-binding protein
VAVISRGRIVAEGSPEQLRRASDVDPEVSFRLASPDLLEFLPERYRRHLSSRLGEVRFRTATPTADLHELTGWALGRGVELAGLQVADPTLEDVYLALVEADGS